VITVSGIIKRLIPTKSLGVVDQALWADILIPTSTKQVALGLAAREASTSARVGISCLTTRTEIALVERPRRKRARADTAETLAAYNFTITYRKGSKNARADALSQRTNYIGPKQERPRAILKKTDAGIQYNELLATILIVEDTELKKRLKNAYATDECAKRVLNKVDSNFAINEQGLIQYKGLVFKEADRDSSKRVQHL
ncbi:hypothetical protein V498_04769, partial [Pseudogymnoascus sp. VKM F-4517 (FW-2822)]